MTTDDQWGRRKFLALSGAGLGAALTGCAALDARGWRSMVGEAVGMATQPLPALDRTAAGVVEQGWFEEIIASFVNDGALNSLEAEHAGETIFKTSLVGFARGDDPIFEEYKTIIGPFHHTPVEAMAWAAESQGVTAPAAAEIGVISFILPLADSVVHDNAAEDRWCSKRWAQGRLLGELFCQKLTQTMLEELGRMGVLAVSPDLMPDFRKKRYPEVGWASPWSHRHMAFAAGMGSFGMNDFFISEMGSAHRCGSIVAALPVTPNRERSAHHREHCLHHQTGGCLACARRCPVGATSEAGHDKDRCSQNVLGNVPHNQIVNQVNIYGCGLCATGTPCSQQVPEV